MTMGARQPGTDVAASTVPATSRQQRKVTRATFLLVAVASIFAGCGTIPNANALLHTNPVYLVSPRFVGPDGPVTTQQATHIIDRLEEHQQVPSDLLERHLAFEQAISNVPLVLGNKVTLLENGATTYKAMLAAIRNAHDSIDIAMYIFSDGPIGQMFANALIERQRHGVQVNLMYDSLGSLTTSRSFFDRLRQNGIAVLQYRPVNPFESTLQWTFSHRNHRKMLIVDGRVAFTGGINISEVYASGLHSGGKNVLLQSWRDTDIQIEGPVVAEFQQLFIAEWQYQKGLALMPRDYYPKLERQGNQIVRVIASVPERFSSIYVTMISAIVNSETNVYITDAYFAPDHQMLHALEHAARRGVDVRLLLPSQSDEPLLISAARSDYAALLKSGVKVYEWQGEMLHAKTATVDGVWSTVGTSNLDWWSIARDNEVNAVILSHSFASEMNAMFLNDLKNAHEIQLDQWKKRGLSERLHETFASAIVPLL
jgi:cardiolipin synthase A/B